MSIPPGFQYVSDFLGAAEQSTLLSCLRGLELSHDTFRGQTLRRAHAGFGHRYLATGRQLAAAPPMPDFLRVVLDRARLMLTVEGEFHQCSVTRYPPGAGIGWHTDAPMYGDTILGTSLAGAGRMQFRPNGTGEPGYEITLAPGSAYLIGGPARWDYQHRVIPVRAERYSLTFRSVGTSRMRDV